MAPESVGPYRILQKLGSGGMGDVYLAEDTRLRRRVALKSLSKSWARNPEARRRLVHEAQAVAALNHPSIAAVYDVVDSEDETYIVMEFVPGQTLAEKLRLGRMEPQAATFLCLQLLSALREAHARGIVHRDLKPANLMLMPDGRLKVLDFGLAKTLDMGLAQGDDSEAIDLSGSGRRLVGTPPYLPPEHILGGEVDERSDIYGVGVVLYELLTGRRPFDGPNAPAIAEAIVTQRTPRVRELAPEVPQILDDVVAQAMARRPEDRYASASALRAVLERLRDDQPDWATVSTADAIPSPSPRLRSHRRRRRRLGWMATVAIVPAILALWAFWSHLDKPSLPPVSQRPPVVAVLPLSNASGDPAYDALVVGFADVIVNALIGPDVNVVSRSAVMEAREKSPQTSRITHELGVDLFIEGSVQRSATQVRIALSIARVATNVVTWSRVFEGGADDMLALQKGAAQAVAEAIKGGISAEDLARIERNVPTNQEALEKYGQARRLLDRADVTGNAARAADLFEEAVAKEPTFALAAAGLAEAQWARYAETKDQRFAEEARRAVDLALRLDPGQSQVRLSLAEQLGRTGKTAEAIAETRRVLLNQPASDDAHRGLGELLIRQGEVPEGLAELHRAMALRPDFWKNHDALGIAFFDLGRYAEAAESWRRVTQLLPGSSWGYEQRAAALYAAGDRAQAASQYRRAIELDPSPQAWSGLGAIAYAEGRYTEAQTDIEAALRLDRRFASGYRNLGDVLARQGDRRGARRAYEKAVELTQEQIEINPANGLILARLAVYLAKAGQMDKALASIDKAVALAPDQVDVTYRAAVVQALAGRRAEARAALEQAIARGYSRALARDDEDVAYLLDGQAHDAAGGPPPQQRREQ